MYGHENNNENINAAYGQIYEIRYVLNLISAFENFWGSDCNTGYTINFVASIISDATCGVVPAVAIKAVLIALITVFETANDMNRLEAGFMVCLLYTSASGAGQITIRDLIKSSLRMRPERIIVGECRGGEALDMLQAMNTGHDGSLSTGHANSTEDMLSRLETMVLQGADGLPIEAIKQQIASAVDIIIHLSRLRDKSRKTMAITEVVGIKNGEIELSLIHI